MYFAVRRIEYVLSPVRRYCMDGYLFARFLVVYLKRIAVHIDPYLARGVLIGPARKTILVAEIAYCVGFVDLILLHVPVRHLGLPVIRIQVCLFGLEHFVRYEPGAVVRESVGCPRQPTDPLFVQLLDAHERSPPQEVVLYIFHGILHLALRLRVRFPAEDALEVRLADIGIERLGQDIVA